jgi:hypothetical protein
MTPREERVSNEQTRKAITGFPLAYMPYAEWGVGAPGHRVLPGGSTGSRECLADALIDMRNRYAASPIMIAAAVASTPLPLWTFS